MFLKSLDIFGFKSFADRTHIDFADGITALLGPNGCGKSNVVDAMKWVLAENKSKNLRADKMEDVIFNGTEIRPALNVAEVTLTIMNENSLLPLEDSEVAIKRRLFRSGESAYFINNRQVGPTEIRKLFMDTGVGKAAYSVMEQGKIDQILSSKPEDRRYLFEEAAGISRSKAECAEAERELEKTRQNLQQIEIALTEIKRNYDTLKVQSEKTIKYRKVKDEVFELQLDLQLLKLKGFIETKARNENTLAEVEKKRNEVREEIAAINNSISENTDQVNEMQNEVYRLQAEIIAIQTEKSGKLEMEKQFNARAQEITEKITQLELAKKKIQDRIDELNDEIGDAESELHDKKKLLSDIQKNIQSFRENIETASSQISENDLQVSQKQQQIAELAKRRAELQEELTAITEDIVTELDAKLKDAGYSETAMNSAKSALDEVLAKLKVFTEGRKNIFSDFANAGCHSNEDGTRMGQDAAKAFDESLKMITVLEEALAKYIKASPQFIGEFLAPEGIITKKRDVDAKIQENLDQVEDINSFIEELKSENANLIVKIDEYRATLSNLQINEVKMKEQISANETQMQLFRRNIAFEENNLRTNEEEFFAETKRREDMEERIAGIQDELAEIEAKGIETAKKLTALDEAIAECNSKVSDKKNDLNKKNELQRKYQTQFEQLSISMGQIDTEIRNVKQNFLDQYSRDLMEYEEHMYTISTPAAVLKDKLSTQKEEMDRLSRGINFMAPEEFAEVKERYERQQANYDDTKKSLADLEIISEEIKSKSSELFLETYNKIKRNFHNMFRRLFGGGRGELRLQTPENVLTTGIDIYAQPPGKKLENISLLSGGEKTMTAIALLFATYQVRPSPFCLLDEIDAALDEKNVSSFVTALRSFANISQYIVITHNKKTVTGASTMLGVTMEESGVSKIIAIRLDDDVDSIKRNSTEEEDNFIDEDVPPEEGVVIPPRPVIKNRNEDGKTQPETADIENAGGFNLQTEAIESVQENTDTAIHEEDDGNAENGAGENS